MSTTVTMKQDPAADWTSRNPVLGQFEIGIESDTGKAKIGDGVTAWTGPRPQDQGIHQGHRAKRGTQGRVGGDARRYGRRIKQRTGEIVWRT